MMKSIFSVLAATTVLLSTLPTAFAQYSYYGDNSGGYQPAPQSNYGYSNSGYPTLQGHVVTVPAMTMLNSNLQNTLSSEYARVGEPVTATLGMDLSAGGSVVVPAGSTLNGQVVSLRKAGRAGRPGELEIRFNAATLPNGQQVPLSARIQTEDGSGIIKGTGTAGRVGRAALRTGLGAGLGAALGTAMGPLSGGSVGRGAIYGTAVGGGMGAVSAIADKGPEAVLNSGPVQVVLDAPLTAAPYNAMQGGNYAAPANYGAQPQYNQYDNQPYSQPYAQPAQQNYPYGY